MAGASYTQLSPESVCQTMQLLAQRIEERFPESGLSKVARELVVIAAEDRAGFEHVHRPLWWVRGLIVLLIVALGSILVWAAFQLAHIVEVGKINVPELLQAVDAGTNELVVLALGLFFLVSLEARIKRRSALRRLHRLRSVAHVVDMHQLTKDPEHALHDIAPTASSPVRELTRPQLLRYLDYCSELLALTSKLAALHAQHLQDPVVLDAVNDIESLTADLSGKIWQKITILELQSSARRDAPR